MPEAIENYTPQAFLLRMRKQARTVWSVSFLIVFTWVFLILLAPFAAVNNFTGVSAPIYKFFSYICHQIPARSFHYAEYALAVCSRCFGVYFGLFFGFIIYPLFKKIEEVEPLPRFWLFLAMIPIGIDWTLGVFGIWENTHFSRFVTGMILGAACAVFIVPALVEIVWLLTGKKQLKK
ncbi:MAG: DUF2085 domain-containing protein [Acidobacteriota bacterium]|nr:DUF2085 domain-containing protein [Acidobacteriota bacterium]